MGWRLGPGRGILAPWGADVSLGSSGFLALIAAEVGTVLREEVLGHLICTQGSLLNPWESHGAAHLSNLLFRHLGPTIPSHRVAGSSTGELVRDFSRAPSCGSSPPSPPPQTAS